MLDDNRPILRLLPRLGPTPIFRIPSECMITKRNRCDELQSSLISRLMELRLANLAVKFKSKSGVGSTIEQLITKLARGKLMISAADKQGNVTRIERSFSAGGKQ